MRLETAPPLLARQATIGTRTISWILLSLPPHSLLGMTGFMSTGPTRVVPPSCGASSRSGLILALGYVVGQLATELHSNLAMRRLTMEEAMDGGEP